MALLLYLVSSLALWTVSHGYYIYQTKIPNGQHVPHPCKPNYIWHGVGHRNPLGGGERNPFGLDFARLGHKWSVTLCQLDSDGDGMTNGQELGDPNCVWTESTVPSRTDNITHPGVCDPWDSQKCAAQNTWMNCDVGEFQCDAIHEPGVRNITLRLPRTKVPTDETTYECFVFDVSMLGDQPYHLIAFEAYIDNPNVMHHMAAFACDDSVPLMDKPDTCNMAAMGCNTMIGVWTLGMLGDCMHPDAGFRIGKGASTRLAIQYHWTNKHHVDHWYDSSGLTLYYTPHLRPNDAGAMFVGQDFLEIPPGVNSITMSGCCSSACTQRFMYADINITTVLNHMHYLGIGGRLEHIRNGRVIANLSDDNPYSYDNPHVYRYDNPIVVKPGDELKMNCEFSSLGRAHTTVNGPGSYNEMCYGILTFFPAQNIGNIDGCIQWKDLDYCDFNDGGCNIGNAMNSSNPDTADVINQVLENCGTYGTCRKECPDVIARLRQSNACLRGPMWDYIKSNIMTNLEDPQLLKLVTAIEICEDSQSAGNTSLTTSKPGPQHNHVSGTVKPGPHSGTSGKTNAAGAFVELVKALGNRPLLQNIIFSENINYNNGN